MEADYVTPKCKICEWGVIDSTSCVKCNCPLHLNCGFKVQEENTISIICNECGEGKRRLVCETLRDSQLSLQWLPCKKPKSETIEESAFIEMKQQKLELLYEDFFSWVATLDEISYEKKDEAISFYGRNKVVKRVRKIDIILLKDVLFEFFPAQWELFIQGEEGKWFSLPQKLKLFIHSHGRCFAITELSSRFIECHFTDWTYLKFTSETNAPSFICDCQEDFDSGENGAYISFTNNIQNGARIQFVPLYYLQVWLYVCEQKTSYGEKNELLNIINQARNCSNKWIQIPQGASRGNKANPFAPLIEDVKNKPVSFRVQPHWEYSCVFNSIMNAFHYINDYRARDEIFEKMAISLDYTKMSTVSYSRSSFAAYIVNQNLLGYKVIKIPNFNILEDRSMWPTLCVLESTSEISIHAITTVENFIFDSNLTAAVDLNKENLDWCCSTNLNNGRFKKAQVAYRFIKLKPSSNLLLRSSEQRLRALSSIIQSFNYIEDLNTAKALDKLRCDMRNEICLISQVRDFLKRREFGYRPISIRTMENIMCQGNSFPSIFLVGDSINFSYEVLSVVGNVLFDDTQRRTLCCENIYEAVQLPHQSGQKKKGKLEFIFGYVFVKDLKKIVNK